MVRSSIKPHSMKAFLYKLWHMVSIKEPRENGLFEARHLSLDSS